MVRHHCARCRRALHRRRGFTLLELLVVTLVAMGAIALAIPLASRRGCGGCSQSLKDKTQISMIHKSCLTFANDNNQRLPLPGLINRRPSGDRARPTEIEDFSLNTTANIYSALIAQNYFNTDIIIGPTEVNPRIVQKKNYNYNAYKPAIDSYWDTTFVADPTAVCNASYAHLAPVGARKERWIASSESGFAAFSTRGTGGGPNGLGGALTGPAYDKSPTLELHGPKSQWVGNVCFNDNHVETLNTFFAPLCVYSSRSNLGSPAKDNFFAAEFADASVSGVSNPQAAGDSWLIMCTTVEPTRGMFCSPVWDPLNP